MTQVLSKDIQSKEAERLRAYLALVDDFLTLMGNMADDGDAFNEEFNAAIDVNSPGITSVFQLMPNLLTDYALRSPDVSMAMISGAIVQAVYIIAKMSFEIGHRFGVAKAMGLTAELEKQLQPYHDEREELYAKIAKQAVEQNLDRSMLGGNDGEIFH
jgi:hypothetical protein